MAKLDKLYSDNMFLGHRGMFFSNTPFSNQKLNINQQEKEYSVPEVKKLEKKSLLRLIGSGQGKHGGTGGHSKSGQSEGYATAIININQQQKEYSVPEVKKLEKEKLLNLITLGDTKGRGQKSGQSELSRRIGVPQSNSIV